jgi:hypothetical protein
MVLKGGKRNSKYSMKDDEYDMSMHIPFRKCVKCGSKQLEKIETDTSQLTEGEEGNYLAGSRGEVKCLKCGHIMEFEN